MPNEKEEKNIQDFLLGCTEHTITQQEPDTTATTSTQ